MGTPFTPPAEELPPLDDLLTQVDIDMSEVVNIAEERRWAYDPDRDAFIDASGDAVPFNEIRAELNERIDAADQQIERALAETYTGDSTIEDLEEVVVALLLLLLPMFFLFGKGGSISDVTAADINFIESRLRQQIGFLRNFSRDILDGELSQEMIRARFQLYTRDDAIAFEEAWDRLHSDAIFPWYRSVLGGCQHCNDCPTEAAKGFVQRGELIPIGARQCLWRCCCHYEYSRSTQRPTDSLGMLPKGLTIIGQPLLRML